MPRRDVHRGGRKRLRPGDTGPLGGKGCAPTGTTTTRTNRAHAFGRACIVPSCGARRVAHLSARMRRPPLSHRLPPAELVADAAPESVDRAADAARRGT